MGQKTHPYGFRLGYNKTWHSRWYAEDDYADTLVEDVKLRQQLKDRLAHAGVSEIDIERSGDRMRITGHSTGGERFTDYFPLDGVNSAIDAAAAACAAKRLEK